MKKTVSTYVLASSLLAILTISAFALYSIHEYEANEYEELNEKLESSIKTFWQLLEHKGTDFRIANGKLLAGNYPINGNFEMPDKVQEIFGVVATVFMGDVRVSTNVMDSAGKRALGTRLSGPAYDALFKQGKPYRGEAPILGTRYLTAYDPIKDRNGAIIGVLFVGVKVSDFLAPLHRMQLRLVLTLLAKVTVFVIVMLFLGRAMKRAEEATKNAYQRLFDIIEFLPDATFVVDKDKRVIAWNRAIEQMTGVDKRDMIGKDDYSYAIPFYNDKRPLLIDMLDQDQEQERVRLNYTQIKQEGHTLFTEVFVPLFRNGEGRYFWATATPLFDKEGNRVGGIESIRDITEYKHSQEERSQLESRLHHARMMETLMARLGHDLRTPLTPLFVLFPLMRERVSDPGFLRMLDICSKSANAMNRLVDRAQTLVTLSTPVRSERLEHITLLSVVEQAVADNADSISQKNVASSHDIDHHIIVKAIPDQLRELFSNLISNAVRFSPKNGAIRITAERQDTAVTVAVHDEGIGLDPENLERVFDEFFKADESRHDIDAPGLGLSICKRIVLNHHGRIWAESPGMAKGTTIKFTINEHDPDCRYDAKES